MKSGSHSEVGDDVHNGKKGAFGLLSMDDAHYAECYPGFA